MKICELGERPPLGEVPDEMHACIIRQDRFGEPMCECGAKPGESCGEDSDRTFEVPELMETSSLADPARESTAV